jgi:hypothetical protein
MKEKTQSICPQCFKEGKINVIGAKRIIENNSVYLIKFCEKHGEFKSIISTNAKQYIDFQKYWIDSTGVENGKPVINGCPFDCGICKNHKSQSVLTNIFVTNRCNLRCSYCFANAGAEGYIYEPSLEEIKKELQLVRNEKPVSSKALQITGGEPTMRDDLLDIIEYAKKIGFAHIQLNTNGILLSENFSMVDKIRKAGCNTVYFSFDGLDKKTNPWLDQSFKFIENCRKADLGVVLVPVVIKGENDHQLGDIIKFALNNLDIIRGVNFQPVSFVGKINEEDKNKRISFAEVIQKVEEQTDFAIKTSDWRPPGFVNPISKLIELIKKEPQVEFGCSPNCGAATYLFYENEKIMPITSFLDVDALMKAINEIVNQENKLKRVELLVKITKDIGIFINKDKAPKSIPLVKILVNSLIRGDYSDLAEFHKKSLYIGGMWFQDPWNLDLERLERCVIHYTTPDGVIPFCSYNGLDYGSKIRKNNSISIDDWERKNNKKLKDDLWKRNSSLND